MARWRSPNKYCAKKVVIDGHTFDSIKEGQRYQELRLLEGAGKIRDLELQPVFELQPSFLDSSGHRRRAIKYVADFRYFDIEKAQEIVEDVKGFMTQVFRLKEKLLLFKFPNINFQRT